MGIDEYRDDPKIRTSGTTNLIRREHCIGRFSRFPSWRCPECSEGTLELDPKRIHHWPAKGVYEAIEEGNLPRWDDYGVFSATLQCTNISCKQGVAVFGDYACHELGYPEMAYEHRYHVRGIHPALQLIDIPSSTATPIGAALRRSFGLFWCDAQSCATAIRVAIEGIAEHLGQPRENGGKRLSLASRLSKLKTTHPDIAEAASLIKDVGNEGAHGDVVDQEKLLTCYELLEIELRTLFNDRQLRRQALMDTLRK